MDKLEFIKKKQGVEEQYFERYAHNKGINRYHFTCLEESFDVKLQSGDTYYMAEVKIRSDYNTSFFEKYGPYLEYKKINGMFTQKNYIKKTKNLDVDMLYYNFTKDGLQIFLLKEPWHYKFDWEYLPINNYEPNKKEWKLVSKLNNPVETIKN